MKGTEALTWRRFICRFLQKNSFWSFQLASKHFSSKWSEWRTSSLEAYPLYWLLRARLSSVFLNLVIERNFCPYFKRWNYCNNCFIQDHVSTFKSWLYVNTLFITSCLILRHQCFTVAGYEKKYFFFQWRITVITFQTLDDIVSVIAYRCYQFNVLLNSRNLRFSGKYVIFLEFQFREICLRGDA